MQRGTIRHVRLRIALSSVALLAAAACVSVGTPTPSSSGSGDPSSAGPSSSAIPHEPPSSVRADQARVWKADPKSWSIVLKWNPAPGFEADHYEVERNDRTIEDDLPGTRLVDQDVVPETQYRYEVTAVDANDVRTDAASVSVTTTSPRVSDSRLEGQFIMRMHITGQTGLQSGASGSGMLFVYDPACASGPCDVTWSRKGSRGSGRLSRHDGNYDGTVHAPFQLRSCQGGTLTETLVFTTKVVEASVVRGAWRATKVQGTLHETATATGCVVATIDWTFIGFIQT